MRKILCLIMVLIVALCFAACDGRKHKSQQIETLKNINFENAVNGKNISLKYSRRLPDNISGLTPGNNKLILVEHTDSSNNIVHSICIAEYDALKVSVIDYGNFAPLKILYEQFIKKFSEKKQIHNLDIIYEFVEQHGIECFSSTTQCELYIKRLTKSSKLINIDDAKNAIKKHISSKVDKLSVYSETEVIFSSGSAVPEYYAFRDYDDQGSACWKIMNSEFEELSEFEYKTLDELKEYLMPTKHDNTKDYEDKKGDVSEDSENFNESDDLYNNEEDIFENDEDYEEHSQSDYEIDETESADSSYTTEVEEIIYRVRKSAYDSESQLGAFKIFSNAKTLADDNKNLGYEVYDNYGNLVYVP